MERTQEGDKLRMAGIVHDKLGLRSSLYTSSLCVQRGILLSYKIQSGVKLGGYNGHILVLFKRILDPLYSI